MKNYSKFLALGTLALLIATPLATASAVEDLKVFPPKRLDLCDATRGLFAWKFNDHQECRALPALSCPHGTFVFYAEATGFSCGSPVTACAANQGLVVKNLPNGTPVFSCADLTSRITISCDSGYLLRGIVNGTKDCMQIQ